MSTSKVCWLSGNVTDRKLVLDKIRNQFSGFESIVFHGDATYSYLEQQITTSSCFVEKRLFIIETMPPIESKTRASIINRFKKMLDNLPEDVAIVFNMEANDEKALSAHVAKIGKLFDFPLVLDPKEASSWLVGKFQERDKTISEDDAQFIIDMSGYDAEVKGIGIDLLNMLVKKICMYLGNRRKNITRDDILATAFYSENFNIWEMSNALDSKDLERCYRYFEKSILDSDINDAVETLYTISLWRYKMLFHLKEEIAKNNSNAQARQEMLKIPKLSQTNRGGQMRMVTETIKDESGALVPKMLYNAWGLDNAMKFSLEKYTRRELSLIVQVLQCGFGEVRQSYSSNGDKDGILRLLADSLFFTVCLSKTDDKILTAFRTSFSG